MELLGIEMVRKQRIVVFWAQHDASEQLEETNWRDHSKLEMACKFEKIRFGGASYTICAFWSRPDFAAGCARISGTLSFPYVCHVIKIYLVYIFSAGIEPSCSRSPTCPLPSVLPFCRVFRWGFPPSPFISEEVEETPQKTFSNCGLFWFSV